MTNSIPLTDLPVTKPEWRRDQYGRYLIVPPGGGKPEGYTRVTTVAKHARLRRRAGAVESDA